MPYLLVIPDSVTIIGNAAFSGCKAMESVTFGKGLKTTKDKSFSGCAKLKEIKLPEGITSIGGSAFTGCDAVENIYLPSTITSIGSYGIKQSHAHNVYLKKGSYADSYIDSMPDSGKKHVTKVYQ